MEETACRYVEDTSILGKRAIFYLAAQGVHALMTTCIDALDMERTKALSIEELGRTTKGHDIFPYQIQPHSSSPLTLTKTQKLPYKRSNNNLAFPASQKHYL